MFPTGQGCAADNLEVLLDGRRLGATKEHAEEGTRGSPRVTSHLGLSSGELQPGMRKIHVTWGVSTDTSLQP